MINNLDKSLFTETQGKYKIVLNLKQELKTDAEKNFFETFKKSIENAYKKIQMFGKDLFSEKIFCKNVFINNLKFSSLLGINPIQFTITLFRPDGSSIEIKKEDVL